VVEAWAVKFWPKMGDKEVRVVFSIAVVEKAVPKTGSGMLRAIEVWVAFAFEEELTGATAPGMEVVSVENTVE
jgi:hypothetical protein